MPADDEHVADSGALAVLPAPRADLLGRVEHPVARLFPDRDPVVFAQRIRSVDDLPAVTRKDGQIVDGRSILRLCVEREKEPRFEDLPDDADPLEVVVSRNANRMAPLQAAAVAALLVKVRYAREARARQLAAAVHGRTGGRGRRREETLPDTLSGRVSTGEAAEIAARRVGAGVQYTKRMLRIFEDDADVFLAVYDGRFDTFRQVQVVVGLPSAERAAILAGSGPIEPRLPPVQSDANELVGEAIARVRSALEGHPSASIVEDATSLTFFMTADGRAGLAVKCSSSLEEISGVATPTVSGAKTSPVLVVTGLASGVERGLMLQSRDDMGTWVDEVVARSYDNEERTLSRGSVEPKRRPEPAGEPDDPLADEGLSSVDGAIQVTEEEAPPSSGAFSSEPVPTEESPVASTLAEAALRAEGALAGPQRAAAVDLASRLERAGAKASLAAVLRVLASGASWRADMLCALLGAGVPLGPDEIAIFDPIHQEAEQGLKDDESTTVSSAARRSSTANP